jgi:hypothetical protein
MTDLTQNETPSDAPPSPDAVDAGTDGATPAEAPEGKNPLHAEAAKYRTRLRETEAERDALTARVAKLQTAELTRLAAEHLDTPGDLYALTGTTLADYLGEDGELDAEAVADAVAGLLATRPGLRKRQAAVDPSQGHHGGGRPKSTPSWGNLLQP